MAIQKVEDKNKIISSVDLRPKRTFISGSWGVSGSIYVFPNRSETQKDNIDERLNLFPIEDEDNTSNVPLSQMNPVRPFSGNSLEARRLEIYEGNFNKFTTNNVDAISYEYKALNGETNINFSAAPITVDTAFTPESFNAYVKDNPTAMTVGDIITRLNTNGTEWDRFIWTSNNNWNVSGNPPQVYNQLPTTDRDRGALNYEIPLALLLDGADPETFDHAYRSRSAYEAVKGTANYSHGNSSLTGGTKDYFQFTGWNYEMVNGFPSKTSTITSIQEVNAWPPEIEKHGTSIITNYILEGYSDLSMHPRNKTKKNISIDRSNHEYFNKASTKQRMLYREYENKNLYGEGWRTDNSHALSLSPWTDPGGTIRKPALVYRNLNDQYKLDYNSSAVAFHIEFWIKPSKLQTGIGCVCQLHNNYAVMLIPDTLTAVNGVPQKFKISLRTNGAAADGQSVSSDVDHRLGGGTSHVYISSSLLSVEEWQHVSIRWGRNFNNGMMTIYLNNVVIDEFDGIKSASYGGIARTGLINVDASPVTTNHALFVGGYPSDSASKQREIWEAYSDAQNGLTWAAAANGSNTVNSTTGLLSNFAIQFQLLSDLTELRCFNFARSEEIVGTQWPVRISTKANLLFYMPFFFDPSHSNYTKRPYFSPDAHIEPQQLGPDASVVEAYYAGSGADISGNFVPEDSQTIQYCQNWGYIAGVPFVHVHSHSKEHIKNEMPIVLGMPNMTKLNTTVYPNYSGASTVTDVEDKKIQYFIENWYNINWLLCWNSLITPCTINLGSNPTNIIDQSVDNYYKSKITIPLDKVTNLDFSSEKFSGMMFDDDQLVFTSGVEYFENDAEITARWSQDTLNAMSADVKDTTGLSSGGLINPQDILTPFSVVISVPVLYYGNKIEQESLVITTKLHGKEICIVDSHGVLYIADKDKEPTSAKIGHISYEFGYMCIFSPLVSGISLEEIKIELRGQKSMHVLQFDVQCPPGLANESKNINYKNLKASANSSETDSIVTYISTIYLHDENLNVIGKVKLAQPIQKREEDSFLFRIKMDF